MPLSEREKLKLKSDGIGDLRPYPANERPFITKRFTEMAKMAGIRNPELYIEKNDVPNAIILSTHQFSVSEGFLQLFNDREVVAQLGHELGHAKNRFKEQVEDCAPELAVATGAFAGMLIASKCMNRPPEDNPPEGREKPSEVVENEKPTAPPNRRDALKRGARIFGAVVGAVAGRKAGRFVTAAEDNEKVDDIVETSGDARILAAVTGAGAGGIIANKIMNPSHSKASIAPQNRRKLFERGAIYMVAAEIGAFAAHSAEQEELKTTREDDADRVGINLSGDPEAFASALRKAETWAKTNGYTFGEQNYRPMHERINRALDPTQR